MNSKIKILPYKIGSAGAKELARHLSEKLGKKVLRVSPDGSFKPKPHNVVINWGCSTQPVWNCEHFINLPMHVEIAKDKLESFIALEKGGVTHPEWATEKEIAQSWLADGKIVVVRHKLSGHSGEGIELVFPDGKIPDAPLYVQYKKKAAEFRVHVFGDKVIDVQQKKRKKEFEKTEEAESYIRSHDNGWVFCREEIEEPEHLRDIAIAAIQALSLTFGAVDVIYNKKENQCYVLEVNTAPGLEGTSLEIYANAIIDFVNQK